MATSQESEKLFKFVLSLKYLQFLFLAVFFYGTAMLSYDFVQLIEGVFISPWSIGCTVFGGEGVIASYMIMRSTERKLEKLKDEEREGLIPDA